jgi:hypothetical protein
VFINCPFDERYQPLFHALVFAVLDCGFYARSALEVEDGGEVRIHKILRIIGECRYGIHDISRTRLEPHSPSPRFNLPLELGLFMGAREFGAGRQREKRLLILDSERYRYREVCSDISGQDIRAHGDDPARASGAVRAMLATAAGGEARMPGPSTIRARYEEFRDELPALCRSLFVIPPELEFVELRSLMITWLNRRPLLS